MVNSNLISRDLKHIWHPCSQMKDFEQCPPFIVNSAEGSYIHTDRGTLIDAVSSWWCKSLGHGHPEIIAAINTQLSKFEHVISANTTHEPIVQLGEKLAKITQNQRLFLASDGSSAVEIALKLAIQANQLKGNFNRNQFIALKNSYHGETMATLSVSDIGLYKKPFRAFTLPCHFLQPIPYITCSNEKSLEQHDQAWIQTLNEIEPIKASICAIIVEPIVQGAGGMLCYSPDFLSRLAAYCKSEGIYLIADEIMTGLGRTGKWLACDHAHIKADMVCLSKGLTSGTLPLSGVCIDEAIYQLFYDDYDTGKTFLHSHTYSGNPLAVSAALATLTIMEDENINQQAIKLGKLMQKYFTDIANTTGVLSNIRGIGGLIAGDLATGPNKRMGFEIYKQGLKHGALLRPLGNTLYWLPPLNTDKQTIGNLAQITLDSIMNAYK